jgi:hypothetical protein
MFPVLALLTDPEMTLDAGDSAPDIVPDTRSAAAMVAARIKGVKAWGYFMGLD